ncbi:uncharacterized protein LOC122497809 isoform X4 [Leptopilina heterotoma]|uniref:uncharacterized protein LOC122497809 isoform X4 n=1 Tax=Leptopilina heterotoma TaxID=63436 RepID=UPI001CA9E3BF|nr:uncharacterized protein LOC122497809 isoform X4 [Leptopilina heterotoma]
MFQDEGTTIKRELEDDESNGVLEENEVALKKQRTEEVLIKEEEVEIDEDNCIEKSNENNAEDNCEANKNTGNSSERNLQNQNPLEDSFWVQDGLFFEEQDPITLTTNNFPSIAEKPTTSTGASTCQRNDKIPKSEVHLETTSPDSKNAIGSLVGENVNKNTKQVAEDKKSINKDQANLKSENAENSSSEQVDITGLKSYLCSDFEGLAILKTYEKMGILMSKQRECLVHKIIKREEDILFNAHMKGNVDTKNIKPPLFCIKTKRLRDLATDVVTLFPTEIFDTYFTPFTTIKKANGTSTRINAAGKLYLHFSYRRNLLMDAGVIEPLKKVKDPLNFETGFRKATDKEESLLEFICKATELTSVLLDYWKQTFEIRRAEFHEEENRTSLIYQKYKCLQKEFGYELLQIDFKLLIPKKADSFLNRWPLIRSRIIELLQGPRKPKKGPYRKLIEDLEYFTSDKQDYVIFFLLSTLIKQKNPGRITKSTDEELRRKKKLITKDLLRTTQKSSDSEVRDDFFLMVKTASDIDEAIKKRNNFLKKHALSVKILPVFVGSLEKINESYVYIDSGLPDGCKYRVESPMHAIDFSLKMFFIFNYSYPLYASHIWVFIQNVGFTIENAGDSLSSSAKTLKGDIEFIFDAS